MSRSPEIPPPPSKNIDPDNNTNIDEGRGAYDTTGIPKPPPRPKPR